MKMLLPACLPLFIAATGALALPPADQQLLPPDGYKQVWKRSGRGRVFTSANLYGHIDGGAELFLEFGFEQLTVQPYEPATRKASAGREARGIQLEIYRMSDPVAAAGIYLMKCGNETPDPSFRDRHTLNRYQLLLKRDRYFVIINNLEGDEQLAPAMVDFGRFISAQLPAEQPLDLERLLPEKGLIKNSLRLFRGPLALQSIFTLGQGDILQQRHSLTGIAANYQREGGRKTLLMLEYPDEGAAEKAFLYLRDSLDSYLKIEGKNDRGLVFKDYAGEYGVASWRGRQLIVEVHLAGRPNLDR